MNKAARYKLNKWNQTCMKINLSNKVAIISDTICHTTQGILKECPYQKSWSIPHNKRK